MKRIISVFCIAMMTFVLVVPAFAVGTVSDENIMLSEIEHIVSVDVVVDYASAEYGENGEIYYDVINVEELASAYDIDPEKIRAMKYVALPVEEDTYGVSPARIFKRTDIVNVQNIGNVCLNNIVAQQSASNHLSVPVTKSITISATMSNTYRVSVESGVDVEGSTISEAVGFDVSYSLTVSDVTEVVLQPGESVTIVATPYCEMYSFDIEQWKLFNGTKLVGSGYAYRVIGFCTTVYNT